MDCLELLAQQTGPVVDGQLLLKLLMRVLHTTCAATLLGGTLYLRFVLAGAAAGSDDPEAALYAGRRKAWAACVGICTLLLLVSGFYNFLQVFHSHDLPPLYNMAFGVKFLVALVLFAISALIAGKSAAAVKVRQRLKTWLNVAVVCALTLFVIGGLLGKIHGGPKIESEAPAFEPTIGGGEFSDEDFPTTDDLPTLPEL